MKIPMYQVDAFTDKPFGGNPAAVCVLQDWLDDQLLQQIAAENNLADTAFIVPDDSGYHLRWFTPAVEVDLCGHATLATAFIVFQYLQPTLEQISFSTKSGLLKVTREGEKLVMNFPALKPSQPVDSVSKDIVPALTAALGKEPLEVHLAMDLMAVFEDEATVQDIQPDLNKLGAIEQGRGVIVTAKSQNSQEVDFVSRFFGPKIGSSEDSVTGSAHCMLVPFWAERLEKNQLHAKQLSQRGGELFCEYLGERVQLKGQCALFFIGEIHI